MKEIKAISIDKVSLSETILKINVIISNHNFYNIALIEPDINVYLNNAIIGKVELGTNKVIIPGRSEQEYTIYVKADISKHLFGSLIDFIKNQEVPIEVKGNATVKASLFSKQIDVKLYDTISMSTLKSFF